jgi:4-alpha-glucanotransferase
VLYFQYDADGKPLPGSAYARNALATVGTHDLAPIAGFWRGTDLLVRRRAGNIVDDAALAAAQKARDADKAKLLVLLRSEGLLPKAGEPDAEPSIEALAEALQLLLASSASQLIGLSLDDLTLEQEALNTPATSLPDAPNWSRRSSLSIDELRGDERIRALVSRLRQRAFAP